MKVLLLLIVLAAIVALVALVLGYFNSGSRDSKKDSKQAKEELHAANRRVSIAQRALIEIASGDALPIIRAADALAEISNSYEKGTK